MAVKQNDWFAINLMNDNVDTLDLMAQGITADNTSMGSRESYKQLKDVQDKFKTASGKFDEDAFNKMYDSCLLTYNSLANNEFEKSFLKSVEQHPNYWLDPDAPVLNTNATVTLSDDPYHRGMGLSGLQSISDPNWTVREIAQAQEVTDEDGNGLGWTPNDHTLLNGSLKSLWQPTLAIATWDEDGYHEDADGNKIKHRKGEYKLRNGEFYYEKLGNRSGVGKEILRISDTVTVDGTWINKFDLFDADSVDKSIGGTIARTALEIAPMLIPGVNVWLGAAGMAFHTVEAMPEIAKSLNGLFGGEKNDFGKSLNKTSNFFKRFASTQSDKGREKFMSFEQVGTQIVDVAGQLYQQKFAAQFGGWLSKAFSGKERPNPKVGRAFSTAYMAATSGMDTYDTAKEAGLSDTWAGIMTLGVMAGFYTLMSGDYYKETLFGEDSWLNEEFVTKNTLKSIGKEIEAAAKGMSVEPTPIQAKSVFQKFYEKTKSGISKSWKKLKQGTSKEKVGEAVATAEVKTATETANTTAAKLTASEVRQKAQKAVNFGKLGQGNDSGTSWFNIMLNRASNEGLEEIMEEAMTDTWKAVSLGAQALGFNVSEDEDKKVDWGFSFEDFLTRYLTAGIGGFVGGSLFAAIDKWEKIWTPNMREITSKGISNGERLVYLIQQEGGTEGLISKINKLEKEGAFGSQNLSLKGHAVTDIKGETKWVFDEALDDKSDSQNAQIAKGLRAYVDYIHRALGAYDFLKNRDELTGIFLEARTENEAGLEKYKEENEFGYKQLEKQLNKENKARKKAGLPELTMMDMYERYNYSDLAVRAMAKAGLFEDFYHDYSMLGAEVVGLQYNLDAQKSDYLQNHPNDLEGWNNNPTKKRLENKIKEIEKQRDDMLSGKSVGKFVERAIYECWDPVNEQMLKMENKENTTPLAERSLYDYAMNRYGLDINDSDMTADERKILEDDFNTYKGLNKRDKIRASFDVFYNIAKLLQPEFEEYYDKRTTKAINPYFKTNIDAVNVQRQVAEIQRQISDVEQRMKDLGVRPNNEVVEKWDPAVQWTSKLFDSFGILYDDIIWEDSSWKAEGAWDPTTKKFHIKKTSDKAQLTNTIIHEVVGHYGLRQIFNNPTMKAKITSLTGIVDTTLDNGDPTSMIMDYLYDIAEAGIKKKILNEGIASKYGFSGIGESTNIFRNTFDKVINEWATPPEDKNTDDTYKKVREVIKQTIGDIDWSTKTDDEKTNAFNRVKRFGIRYLTEEYLADLAGRSFDEKTLDTEEKSWFGKIVKFFEDLFGISGDQGEDFFRNLMMASAQNLRKNSIDKHVQGVLKNRFSTKVWENGMLNYGDRAKYKVKEREALILENLKKFDAGNIRQTIEDEYRTVTDRTRIVTPSSDLDSRSFVGVNSLKALVEILLFNGQAIPDSVTESWGLSGKSLDSLFTVIGYNGVSVKKGIRAIAYNDKIMADVAGWFTNIVKSIDPNIKVLSYKSLAKEEVVKGVPTGKNIDALKRWDDEQVKAKWESTPNYETFIKDRVDYIGDLFGWTSEKRAYCLNKIRLGNWDIIDRNICEAFDTGLTFGEKNEPLILYNIVYADQFKDIDPTQYSSIFLDYLNPYYEEQVNKGNLIKIGTFDYREKKKDLYVTPSVFETIKSSEDTTEDLPAKRALMQERDKLAAQLEQLNLISLNTKWELSDIKEAKELKLALDARLGNIGNPTDPNISQNAAEFLTLLNAYTTYCKDHNVDDSNNNFVITYINTLKKACYDRLKFEILDRISSVNGGDEVETNDAIEIGLPGTSLDEQLEKFINAKFNDDVDEAENAKEFICNIGVPGDILRSLLDNFVLPEGKIQEITDALVPELEDFSKILSKLKVNRLGQTLSLYKYVKLGLKGSEPDSQAKLQDYVMEAPDAKELLDVLENASTLLATIAYGGARINSLSMFDFWNMYSGDSESFFVFNDGERTLQVFKDDHDRLTNKLNFLKGLTEKNSERQIKVQKIIAKKMNINLVNAILKGGKLFNVDIPEVWRDVNDALPIVTEDMSDEEYGKFFEQIKKFEKALYEKIHEDSLYKTATEEDIVNAINAYLNLDTNENLNPGVIGENDFNLSKVTTASYFYSIIQNNSDEFYTKLGQIFNDNPDIKIPFPAQLLCIRIAHAFINDSGNGFNYLCEKFGVNKDVFVKNVYGIFGSAGTGKTTVIANILGKLNSDKNIYFGSAAKAQIDKLKSAVNTDDEHLVQINDLIGQLDPDYKSHTKYNDNEYYYTYTGTINPSSYDSKLKDGVLIVDESTRLNSVKWNVLSKWAEANNVKIIALGDLKQSTELSIINPATGDPAYFTDLTFLRTPILSESIRPGNQAQRSNLLIFGKVLDSAIEQLLITRDLNAALNAMCTSGFTLRYKNTTGKIIGTNITDDSSEFKSKIIEVSENLKDGEKIAIITEGHDYDTLASDKIEIINPANAQGNEWDYVFVDAPMNPTQFPDFQMFYTIMSRSKYGSLILSSNLKNSLKDEYNITFAEDKEGDLPIAASDAQFKSYNEWMSTILKEVATPTTGTTTGTTTTTSSTTSSSPTTSSVSPEARKRFLAEATTYYNVPDFYVDNLDDEFLLNICNTIAVQNVRDFGGNKKVGKYKGGLFAKIKISDSVSIPFFRIQNADGTYTWQPADIDGVGNVKVDTNLATSNFVKKLGTVLDQSLKSEIRSAVNVSYDDLFKDKITPETTEEAIDDLVMESAISTLTDFSDDINAVANVYKDSASVSEYLKKVKEKLEKVKATVNNVDDNFYVKFLNRKVYGNDAFKSKLFDTSESSKKRAIKIISDLVKLDARKVSSAVPRYVKDITPKRLAYIKSQLEIAMSPDIVNKILDEIFSNTHIFYIKDTSVSGTKEMYLQVENMQIFVGVLRNCNYKQGTYKQDGDFQLLFRRTPISARGTKRTPIDELKKDGMIQFAEPAIIVADEGTNQLYNDLKAQVTAGTATPNTRNFVAWMERNNGKTMQAYTNISYLNMEDLQDIYQVTSEADPDNPENTYHWGYNDTYGSIMGVQKSVKLSQLYVLSILAHYAQTGDPEFLQLVQQAFPDITSQKDAIKKISNLLGSSGNMVEIEDSDLPATRRSKITENKKNFTRAGLMVNSKQNEKIQTAAILAMFDSDFVDKNYSLSSFLLGFTDAGNKFNFENNSLGLRFTIYKNNNFYSGEDGNEIRGEYKLIKTSFKDWTLFFKQNNGTWKRLYKGDSTLLDRNNFNFIIQQISNDLGEHDKTIEEFIKNNASIQIIKNYKKDDKWNDFNLNIVDFFVNLLNNDAFGDPSILFGKMENYFNSIGNGIFRSGIYLETRSTGSHYLTNTGNPQDSFWKETTTSDSDIPYSTDIIKIFNPIRSVYLIPFTGTTTKYTDSDFVAQFDGKEALENSLITDAAKTIKDATDSSDFISKLNQKLKEDSIRNKTVAYVNCDSEGNIIYKYNQETLTDIFGKPVKVNQFNSSRIAIEVDGEIKIYDPYDLKKDDPIKEFSTKVITDLENYRDASSDEDLKNEINHFIEDLYNNNIPSPTMYDKNYKKLRTIRLVVEAKIKNAPEKKILTNIFEMWKSC